MVNDFFSLYGLLQLYTLSVIMERIRANIFLRMKFETSALGKLVISTFDKK